MTSDHRVTPGLVHDIVDALERHGYYRSDDLHADRAVGLIGDLACVYEGTQDHPACPGPTRHGTITVTRADAITIFAASDIAADDKRYRVEMCPDCPDQSCSACQTHLRDAEAFDQMAGRMPQAVQAAAATPASAGQIAGPSPPPTGRQAGRPPAGNPMNRPTVRLLRPSSLDPRPASGTMPETADPYDLPLPRPVAAPPDVRDRRRPAPRLAARPAALPGRAARSRTRPHPRTRTRPGSRTMTVTIDDTTMTSDQTAHAARLARGGQHLWEVSWLPGRALDRNSAITAMTLADSGRRTWPERAAPPVAIHPGLGSRTRPDRSRRDQPGIPTR